MGFRITGQMLIVVPFLFLAGCVATPKTSLPIGELLDAYPILEPGDKETYLALIRALKANDAETIASLVRYPIELSIGKRGFVVEDSDQFLGIYKGAMPKELRSQILKQNPDSLLVNWRGVALVHGRVWIVDGKIVSLISDKHAGETGWDGVSYIEPQGRRIIHPVGDREFENAVKDLGTVLPNLQTSGNKFFLRDDTGRTDYSADYVVYVADVNNDGQSDYLVVWTSCGSGHFQGIGGVWSKIANQIVRLPLEKDFSRALGMEVPEDDRFDWSKVVAECFPYPFLVVKDGTTYIRLEDDACYCWKEGEMIRGDPSQ